MFNQVFTDGKNSSALELTFHTQISRTIEAVLNKVYTVLVVVYRSWMSFNIGFQKLLFKNIQNHNVKTHWRKD
jgi:hypothetical protein